ncbi:histidine kinase [Caulobacter sp. Root1455]|uniref:sensor histidine kinase n=1 Tax=Caulobacter sp. Root1455 TaxID=1736465 RepID=UPI0006FF4C4F|nr:HAMP domain-containing sensor histidine kinase [Caulobacter sp. Root1455]KQY99112.1 histidine kinase [Caulobacter sp. Root1455]
MSSWLRTWWPALRLRTILLTVLLFAAAMPAIGAVFLRTYENTLVRQTEAELTSQGAALASAAANLWPGAAPDLTPADPDARDDPGYYRPEATSIDLRGTPVLPERPTSVPGAKADPQAEAAAEVLEPIFDQTSRSTLASIVIVDRHGVVVRGLGQGGSLAALPEIQAALHGHSRTVLRRNGAYHPRYSFEWLSRASAVRLHHARPVTVNGQVVGALLLSRSPRALFRGVYQDRGKLLIGAGATILLLVLLSGLVSRGVTRPIEALSAATRSVAAGQGSVPETPATAAVEIRDLYQDFRVMADAIAVRSRYLRDFASAVSHEFKTPLAGITGAVELLDDHFDTMSDAERRRFLSNISADSARLSHLVGRLMDLARADMAMPQAGVVTDLASPLRRVVDAQGGRGLDVVLDLPAGLPPAAAPEATIEAVLTSLAENSRQAGATTVRISGAAVGDEIVLRIADNGPGVPAADRDRLFEPFFTSRRETGGTGLGLSIARSLLAASSGRIRLVEGEAGAVFEVVVLRG